MYADKPGYVKHVTSDGNQLFIEHFGNLLILNLNMFIVRRKREYDDTNTQTDPHAKARTFTLPKQQISRKSFDDPMLLNIEDNT